MLWLHKRKNSWNLSPKLKNFVAAIKKNFNHVIKFSEWGVFEVSNQHREATTDCCGYPTIHQQDMISMSHSHQIIQSWEANIGTLEGKLHRERTGDSLGIGNLMSFIMPSPLNRHLNSKIILKTF